MRREIPLIYTLKAFCAFAVVAIHSNLAHKELIIPLLRVAVPIFFIISGYFYNIKSTPKILKKIFKLCIVTNVIYVLFHILTNAYKGDNYILENFNVTFFIRQLFWGNMIEGVLWYLTAYLEVLIILWLLQRHFKLKHIAIISLFLLIIGIICGSYGKVFHTQNYLLTGGALMIGLPSVVAGMLIRIYEARVIQFNIIKTFLVLSLFSYIEYYILFKYNNYSYVFGGDVFIFTLPLAISIFIFVIKNKYLHIPIIEYIGKKDSTFIYSYHMLIQYCIMFTFGFCNFFILLSTCLFLKFLYNKIYTRT